MLIEHRYRIDGRIPGGFELYGAVSRTCPAAHGAGWAIAARSPGFVIRGPERAPALRSLLLGARPVGVEHAESAPLQPAPVLDAALVIVRLMRPPDDREEFRARVESLIIERARALGAVGVDVAQSERGVRVHGRLVRGFAVRVETPDPASALAILEHGIGGKRSMGCGVFFPSDLTDGSMKVRHPLACRAAAWR